MSLDRRIPSSDGRLGTFDGAGALGGEEMDNELYAEIDRLRAEVARLTDRHEVDQERVRKAYDAVARGVDTEDRLGEELNRMCYENNRLCDDVFRLEGDVKRLRECVRVRDVDRDIRNLESGEYTCSMCGALWGYGCWEHCPTVTHPLDPLPGKPDEEA